MEATLLGRVWLKAPGDYKIGTPSTDQRVAVHLLVTTTPTDSPQHEYDDDHNYSCSSSLSCCCY